MDFSPLYYFLSQPSPVSSSLRFLLPARSTFVVADTHLLILPVSIVFALAAESYCGTNATFFYPNTSSLKRLDDTKRALALFLFFSAVSLSAGGVCRGSPTAAPVGVILDRMTPLGSHADSLLISLPGQRERAHCFTSPLLLLRPVPSRIVVLQTKTARSPAAPRCFVDQQERSSTL